MKQLRVMLEKMQNNQIYKKFSKITNSSKLSVFKIVSFCVLFYCFNLFFQKSFLHYQRSRSIRRIESVENKKDEAPIYIVWSRWRSGSSIVGQLLAQARNNTFYSYEPLHGLGLRVFGQRDSAINFSLQYLYEIFDCKYEPHVAMVEYYKRTHFYFQYNPVLVQNCEPLTECYSKENLTYYCKNADRQVMKLLRLNIDYAQHLLDHDTRIKIIYLARDPRATSKSRSRLLWCLGTKDCRDSETVCRSLNEDIIISKKLLKMYPNRFHFLRYEDFANSPKNTFEKLWTALGEKMNSEIAEMVKAHTAQNIETGTYGLKKDASETLNSWRVSMDYKSLKEIQNKCEIPMRSLGYYFFDNEEDFDNLNAAAFDIDWRLDISEDEDVTEN